MSECLRRLAAACVSAVTGGDCSGSFFSIHVGNIWIYVICRVPPSVQLAVFHGKSFNVWTLSVNFSINLFIPVNFSISLFISVNFLINLFITAMLVGAIDFSHFI